MPGFNYGGGQGDGTGWSSERGNGPAPGGGSHGNAGNNNGSTGSGNGMTNPALSVAVNKTVGDNLVRSFGMDPKQFVGYFLREDGHVLGITTYSLGDAYGVDLGFAQPTLAVMAVMALVPLMLPQLTRVTFLRLAWQR